MKKLGAFLMALSLIIILFSGCNHPRELKPETTKITKFDGNTIHVFTETSKVSLDSSLLCRAEKKEKILWSYQNPGKKIEFSSDIDVDYLAKSLWTKSNITKKLTLISYDQKQGKIIPEIFIEKRVLINWIPISMFLILFIGLVISALGKDPKGNTLILFFTVCKFVLLINIFLPDYDSNLEVVLISAAGTIIFLFVLMIMAFVIESFQGNKIPMPYQQNNGSLVLAYAFACALDFVRFTNLSGALHYVFLIFLSPYLIAWSVMGIKTIIKKRPQLKRVN
ncbi:MAG: hypothetical protein WCK59_03395 [Candidatus Falkowbacteria bacterium]